MLNVNVIFYLFLNKGDTLLPHLLRQMNCCLQLTTTVSPNILRPMYTFPQLSADWSHTHCAQVHTLPSTFI